MFDTRGVLEYYCYVDVVSRIYHIAHVSLLCFVSYRPYVIYDWLRVLYFGFDASVCVLLQLIRFMISDYLFFSVTISL